MVKCSDTGVCSFACFFFMLWYCSFLKCWWQENENTPTKHFMKNAKHLKIKEKGESNKDVAAKYNVPKNTLSNWVKNKDKLFHALKKGTNVKRQKFKSGNHELVDQPIFNWFLNIRSQNVPLSASMIQDSVIFAKEFLPKTFRLQMAGHDAGSKEIINHSRLFPGSRHTRDG